MKHVARRVSVYEYEMRERIPRCVYPRLCIFRPAFFLPTSSLCKKVDCRLHAPSLSRARTREQLD